MSICCLYVYMFGWLCRATYCSVVSTSMLGYHMLFKTRRNSGSLHRVMGEVSVPGLLVVVYKIPYSSCVFNTAVVLEPGTMVCAYHTAVYLVHRSCLCHTYEWFPSISWILDLSILLSICRAYIYIPGIYVRLVMPSYVLFCCIYFNAWCCIVELFSMSTSIGT